ncbi:uncharacterized protein LOC144113876 [Amblyomma americanum]
MLLRRKFPSVSGTRGQTNANGDMAQEKTESDLEDCQRLSTTGKSKLKSNFFKSLREHWRKRKTKLGVQSGTEKCPVVPESSTRIRGVTVYRPGSSSLAAPESHQGARNDANDNYVRARVGSNGESACSSVDAESEAPRRSMPASVREGQPEPVGGTTEHSDHGQPSSEQRRTACSMQPPATNSNWCLSHPTSGFSHSCSSSAPEVQWKCTGPHTDGTTQPAAGAGYSEASAAAEGPQVPPRPALRGATASVFAPGMDGREDPRISSLSEELFKLSKHGWYWGPITRSEAEEKLADQPDGAFLVRDSSDDRYLLSLTFKSYGKTLHTRIEHCNGLFSFYAQSGPEGRACIVDLIQESMNYSQSGVFCYSRGRSPGVPSFPVRLIKPVSRLTHVRSLQYLCRFVIRQYTRFDHIQRLPLPSRIKGYLEEGHY